MSLKYGKYVLTNARHISQIESVLRSLTLFAPGQNNETEILSEAVSAVLQALGAYQDELAAQVALKVEGSGVTRSAHSKYIDAVFRDRVYSAFAHTLTAIQCAELLGEMLARRRHGEKGRWAFIAAAEALKVALRLLLLSKGKPLPSPLGYDRELSPDVIEKLVEEADRVDAVVGAIHADKDYQAGNQDLAEKQVSAPGPLRPWRMPRTGKLLPPTPLNAREMLASKQLRPEDVCPGLDLLRSLSPVLTLAEVMSVCRPLVYVALAYKFRGRPRNWTPWLVGLLVEFCARQLTARELTRGSAPTSLETKLLMKKTSSLWWWLLRGPAYEQYTRVWATTVANHLERIPLLQIGGVLLNDYLYLLDSFYFSSASQ